jgi:hypothetical protein
MHRRTQTALVTHGQQATSARLFESARRATWAMGAGIVLFYDWSWPPITLAFLSLVSWVVTGWVVAVLGYKIGTRFKAFFHAHEDR